jgi:hypothetical protein
VPRKRDDRLEDWLTSSEAAQVMTANSGHPISADYVRWLGSAGKLTTKALGARMKLFLRHDVERYVVETKRGPKSRHAKEAA